MFDKTFKRKIKLRIGFTLLERFKEFNLNHCIVIKPFYNDSYIFFKEEIKNLIFFKWSIGLFINILTKIFRFSYLTNFKILFQEKFSKYSIKNAEIFCYLDQIKSDKSYITLSDEKDEYGRYIPKIHISNFNNELESAIYVQKEISNIFLNSKFQFKPYKLNKNSFYSGQHHSGTARIGFDENSGVVDKDLKFFETNNLFVCDSSIFSNFGNSNPSLTILAFAHRLANYLKNSVKN